MENKKPLWYNPFKKYLMAFILSDNSSEDNDVYYTTIQLLKMDWKYVVYYFKKYIWKVITFIFTIYYRVFY